MRTVVALTCLFASPALAQELDCSRAVTQLQMNECAQRDRQAAEEELNRIYQLALAEAEERDAAYPGRIEGSLRTAQRAWLPYRDATCEAEAALWAGGSAEPMVQAACLTEITQERIEALRKYLAGKPKEARCRAFQQTTPSPSCPLTACPALC